MDQTIITQIIRKTIKTMNTKMILKIYIIHINIKLNMVVTRLNLPVHIQNQAHLAQINHLAPEISMDSKVCIVMDIMEIPIVLLVAKVSLVRQAIINKAHQVHPVAVGVTVAIIGHNWEVEVVTHNIQVLIMAQLHHTHILMVRLAIICRF